MSAPVSEPSRTCAPVMNGVAASGALVPPMPPFATPARAAPSASIATTIAGEGRRSRRFLIVPRDISAPPFESSADPVMSCLLLMDSDLHHRERSTESTQDAAPDAGTQRVRVPLRRDVRLDLPPRRQGAPEGLAAGVGPRRHHPRRLGQRADREGEASDD